MEQPESTWIRALRNLSEYGLQICVYDDWKYVHIISVKNGTKPRPSDAMTFSPLTVKHQFCVWNNSDQRDQHLLSLIIFLLIKEKLQPCKQQYVI